MNDNKRTTCEDKLKTALAECKWVEERLKTAEEEKIKLRGQLFQAQRMEALGQIAVRVTHDLNNLLSVIGTFSYILEKKIEEDSSLRVYTDHIDEAVKKAADLINGMLAYSRALEENTSGHIELSEGMKTILLVEDEHALRSAILTVLQAAGHTVLTAEDGEDAANRFMENKDSIDIVIMDVISPRKNGKNACDAIRKIQPDVKIIFTGGYVDDIGTRTEILHDGLQFIPKPVSPGEFLERIKAVLDK